MSFPSSSQTPSPDPNYITPAEPRLLTRTLKAEPEPTAKRGSENSRFDKPRRKSLVRGALGLIVLLLLLVPSTMLWLRHALSKSLPELDGTVQTAGLTASVTVARDAHGVPSIQASTLDDLLFAQGFVTAQDRLWQMDTLRRHAAGELAEILGSKLISHDKAQRYLQLRAAADHAIEVLPPDQLHQLQAYARGVNSFLAANADHLPIEFHILHYQPAPWTPRDSLLVALAMAQDLSTEFPVKLARETLTQHLPPELVEDLYPVGSWRDHPPGETSSDLTSPRPEIEQIPLDDSQTRLELPSVTPDDLLKTRTALLQQACDACRSGSNNWVVTGSRSASGKPLLSNDMHLALGVPGIWYEVSLHSADGSLEATGFSLPGTPFVIVGRNAHVAWGFTNLGADTQDLYIEKLRTNGSSDVEFQRPDGTWGPIEHRSERIQVRGGRDVLLDVQMTQHAIGSKQISTPIITPLYPSEHRPISLAWVAYDPSAISSPFLKVDAAADGASLINALADLGAPSLNVVYADDQNHIGYHALGRIPIRGPALHHPVDPVPPEVPGSTRELTPGEDESSLPAAHSQSDRADAERKSGSHPRLLTISLQRRSTSSHPAGKALEQPAPSRRPVETDIAPVPKLLGYTIGSGIPPVPADALRPAAIWSGYVPYDDLPAVTDPPNGILATANARITPDGYPYALALDWAAPYRVERINHILAGRTGITPGDMLHLQMDVHSEFDLALAHRIAYALDQSALAHPSKDSSQGKRLRQAADILRNWNGEVDADAAAPSIIAATRAELLPMLLVPQIVAHDKASGSHISTPEKVAALYSWQEQSYALEQLVLHAPSRWLPKEYATWNDLLTAAVNNVLSHANAPADLAMWAYGKQHPVELKHPLLSATPLFGWLLGVPVGSGPQAIGGDASTVKATGHAFGPSERFTADLSSPDVTSTNITTGQSGNPASPWYMDQLPFWLGGTTLPAPLHGNPPVHTLTLTP